MKEMNLTPTAYFLGYIPVINGTLIPDDFKPKWSSDVSSLSVTVQLVAKNYEDTYKFEKFVWRISYGNAYLDKTTLLFNYSHNYTRKDLEDFNFDTPEEAAEFWQANREKHIENFTVDRKIIQNGEKVEVWSINGTRKLSEE